MSSIPSNLGRIPNLLTSQNALRTITRSNLALFQVQQQISTGLAIQRTSDDAAKSPIIAALDERLERSEQIKRNLDHAEGSLNVLDDALGQATDLAQEAKDLAATQLSFGTSASERANQAVVVDQLIRSLFDTTNRRSPAGFMFGGSVTSRNAIEEFAGGFRYSGVGPGLITDTGPAGGVPITLAAGNVLGSAAARVRGSVDLNPDLTRNTRLSDLSGARQLGITTGQLQFSFDGEPPVTVDLGNADTLGNVLDRLTAAIRAEETRTERTILGPGGVGVVDGAISINVAVDTDGGPNPELEFFEVGSGVTARDLGLAADTAFRFSAGNAAGQDVRPKLTWNTAIEDLAGITGPLGSIRINNMGRAAVVDLSQARTLEDIRNLVEGAKLGVRVSINEAGTGIDMLNEVAAGSQGAMSIEEISGNNLTATRLGLRSFAPETRISDFNDGRGVRIIDGSRDPVTGLPAPERDVDFSITLGNAGATTLTVDLRPQDVLTVESLLARINDETSRQLTAAGLPTNSFVAGLSDDRNGIILTQAAGFGGPIRIDARNNSPAAEQLGLLGGQYDAATSSLRGQDRARVRVDNVFSHLIDLRDSLLRNDVSGIGIAGEKIDQAAGVMAETRAMVGGFGQRIETAQVHHEDQKVLDESIRSGLRDTDFTTAAVRLSQLQTQLEAGLRTTATIGELSLLDFLG
jgi:flagellar hook-associated protein 3 FlgL